MRAVLLISFFLCAYCCCMGDDGAQMYNPGAAGRGGFVCGLNATYIFLNRVGHHVGYDELEREFEEQHPPDSLLAIKSVLGLHGCRTVGIKAGPDYFLQNRKPAIVFLQLGGYGRQAEGHFCYMSSVSRPGGAVLLDPVFDFNEPCRLTWDHFSRIFQEIALVPYD